MNMNMMDLMGMMNGGGAKKTTFSDTSETVIISTVALIKMFKHAQRGVPVEVMGLCVGRFIDKYTVYVQDVFAMPQVGQSDSVEAVDDAYQSEMLEQMKKVGIMENVVGWFHSHPGYFAWLSGVDQRTQLQFEGLEPRCVAIVVDPINSANGRLVIESFRLLEGSFAKQMQMGGAADNQVRITTSQSAFLRKREQATILHGLGQQFYQMCIEFNKLQFEAVVIKKIGQQLWHQVIGSQPNKFGLGNIKQALLAQNWIGMEEEAQALQKEVVQNEIDISVQLGVFQ